MVDRTCKHCQNVFKARQADVNRGWALFCSKSCKAKSQNNSKKRARKIISSSYDTSSVDSSDHRVATILDGWDFSFEHTPGRRDYNDYSDLKLSDY